MNAPDVMVLLKNASIVANTGKDKGMKFEELTTTTFSESVCAKVIVERRHGEYAIAYGNGQAWERCSFFNNIMHGLFEGYDQLGRLERRYFYYHGRRIKRKYAAFLPEKPARKEYKSNRNRFNTLEVT